MIEQKCSCERQMIAALLAGASLAIVLGFVSGWAWDKRAGSLSDVSVLSALTAIGTVGAVFVAAITSTWYARREDLKSQAEQARLQLESQRVASIASTMLLPRLKKIVIDTGQILNFLKMIEISFRDEDQECMPHDFFYATVSQWNKINYAVDINLLLKLESVPDDCVDELAAGLFCLVTLREEVSEFDFDVRYEDLPLDAIREGYIEPWLEEATAAYKLLFSAGGKLQASSRVKI